MKLRTIFSLVGVTSAQQQLSQCHINYADPGENCGLACGYFITEADVFEECGLTIDKPCVTTMHSVTWGSPDCNTCYKVTMHSPEYTGEECAELNCAPYDRSIYVKVLDGNTGDMKFEITQQGWKILCPHICQGSSYCRLDADDCKLGAHEDSENPNGCDAEQPDVPFPNGCHSGMQETTWELVDCADAPPIENPTVPEEDEPTDDGSLVSPTGEQPAPPTGDVGEFEEAHVSCSLVYPGSDTACGDKIDDGMVTNACGESLGNACLTGKLGVIWGSEECGECYEIFYDNSGEATGNTDCAADPCPSYTETLFVRVSDGHSMTTADYMAFQNAWTRICPQICTGQTEYCVKDAADCASGVVEDEMIDNPIGGDQVLFPGSCHAMPKAMQVRVVPCDGSGGEEGSTTEGAAYQHAGVGMLLLTLGAYFV